MINVQEKLKQQINLELEHARVWSSLFTPVLVGLISILFTENSLVDSSAKKAGAAFTLVLIGLIAVTMRSENIERAKRQIQKIEV